MNISDLNKLTKALEFAADKHKFQKRKGETPPPYINHPIQLLHLLTDVGQVEDVDVLCAAVLHDTVEDTATQPSEIERLFGKRVCQIVMECTDDKCLPSMVRKRLQVTHAAEKSHGAKLVKLADKICNIRDILDAPPAHWNKERRMAYLNWSDEVVTQVKGTNEALEELFYTHLQNGKAALDS